MIRTLRRRFILSAMAAFTILLALLVGGISVGGWLNENRLMEDFLEAVLDGEHLHLADGQAPGQFPFAPERRGHHIGHYIIEASAAGEIVSVEEKGMWEPDMEQARSMAHAALSSGKEKGKIEGFAFALLQKEDGGMRIALADNSMRLHMLYDMVGTACLASLACLAMLFVILLPVSRLVVRSYGANIEKQKQFITNAGHDIKTPVAIILSNVDAMELIQGENKWSRNIRGQVERLNALLQRLLFLARIDEQSIVLPRDQVDIGGLFASELESYEEMISEKGITLNCDLPERLCLRGSREYMQQLAHALLDNAVDYTNPGGRISLRMEKKRRRIKLLLCNSVDKLPDCPPENLFDRFYRGDAARTQSGGYGIGLSAARSIAEMHGGKISAEYGSENEICFVLELPRR